MIEYIVFLVFSYIAAVVATLSGFGIPPFLCQELIHLRLHATVVNPRSFVFTIQPLHDNIQGTF